MPTYINQTAVVPDQPNPTRGGLKFLVTENTIPDATQKKSFHTIDTLTEYIQWVSSQIPLYPEQPEYQSQLESEVDKWNDILNQMIERADALGL